MTLDRITTEEVDGLLLSGSPSYVNQALRTLRRLLGKAVEWKVIAVAPRIRLLAEPERQQVLDPESEAKLVAVGKQPLNDILVIIQDTGMRPDEVFRVRIENIDFIGRQIFNPNGKTKASRRYVPMSQPDGRYASTSMRGKNRRVAVSVCEGEERSSNHGGEAVPGGTSGGRLAGLTRTLLSPTCIWHGDLRGNWKLGDGDEGDGAHRCKNRDAPHSRSCTRGHRPAQFTSQSTSQ